MHISELEKNLRKHAETIKNVMTTSFDLEKEIKNMEEHAMNKPKNKSTMKRAISIAAVFALFVITVTMTPLADGVKGFFRDIIRFDGAITGTRYENATHEIKVRAIDIAMDNNTIPLELIFEKPNEAPFVYIQEIAVADYMILDAATGEILKLECYPEYSGRGAIKDGKAFVNLSLNDVNFKSGKEYILLIEKMYGLAKADAPLHIIGAWECKFIK